MRRDYSFQFFQKVNEASVGSLSVCVCLTLNYVYVCAYIMKNYKQRMTILMFYCEVVQL